MAAATDIIATGRRKTAVASIRLKPGTGNFEVNGKDFAEFFPSLSLQNTVLHPFVLANATNAFDFVAKTTGGGITGQAGALRLAIARALIQNDETLRSILKKDGMLTRDPRMRERKKSGQPGARKRFQFSKR